VGVGVGAGVVGGGVTVVGVAVGVFMQVQVGVGAAVVVVADADVVGVGLWSAGADVDAIAECETNSTVMLVTASAMLANPPILARFVIFKAVTPPGLRQNSDARTVRPRPLAPRATALCCPGALLGGHQSAMLSNDEHVTS
jgi:hypothetical protein